MGFSVKAMYGTSETPQIWCDKVRTEMSKLGVEPSVLHPSVLSKIGSEMLVFAYVDDVLCVGPWSGLGNLLASPMKVYDLKSTIV